MINNIEHKLHHLQYPEETTKQAYLYAIKLLARKDYSKFKLQTKLSDKGFPSDLSSDLVTILEEERYLREDYYKEARIRGFIHKGYHPTSIIHKMQQENCPIEMSDIDEVMEDLKISEDSILQDVIMKKIRILESLGITDPTKKENKVIRFALSKGHSLGATKNTLRELLH